MSTSPLYSQFETDRELERAGVCLEYFGHTRIMVARAGGHNHRYQKIATAKTAPYRRAIDTETLPDEHANRLMHEIYAAAVVTDWQSLVDTDKKDKDGVTVQAWKKGIFGRDGELLPVNEANIINAFEDLPDLFKDVRKMAESMNAYRRDVLEESAKN